ncbi:hypothetical protein HA052_19690 [Chromobacterium haemolyticum]|uniref:Uncharacterized protein n=1 Tax=Chromobacterium fluminis TaxID=3044269 RepID=A0ABX0L6H5_9NEIS|nr:hypothetical protein [Chromobacterium haemolyticum]NHR07417.1 hypothetical protein [Chromobacterium haemolyticum]
MNILQNQQAIKILDDAAEKLRSIGLACWVSPTDMREFGMAVSLHVGETELTVSAAHVAQGEGAVAPHLANEKARERFAHQVADFMADAAVFKASGE